MDSNPSGYTGPPENMWTVAGSSPASSAPRKRWDASTMKGATRARAAREERSREAGRASLAGPSQPTEFCTGEAECRRLSRGLLSSRRPTKVPRGTVEGSDGQTTD
jgi:hypothetical protein